VFQIGQKREFDWTMPIPSTADCRLAKHPVVHQEELVPLLLRDRLIHPENLEIRNHSRPPPQSGMLRAHSCLRILLRM
jgi:hypothetical protein